MNTRRGAAQNAQEQLDAMAERAGKLAHEIMG